MSVATNADQMTERKNHARVTRTIERNGTSSASSRLVPEEVPIALSYGGTTQAVMMASPSDLEDFAIGFSLSEQIIQTPNEIEEIEIVDVGQGLDVQIRLQEKVQSAFSTKRRAMAGPVGCGLCGIESIDDVMRSLPVRDEDAVSISADVIIKAISDLDASQQMRAETGAVHAAGFVGSDGQLQVVREDVGRHNALDKIVGALAQTDLNPQDGLIIMTSRVSVDLIQKTIIANVPILVAVSTPTALAIRTAEQAGLTLVALAREDGFEIYTHPHRILPSAPSNGAHTNGENSDVA